MYVIYNDQIRVIDASITAKMLPHGGNTQSPLNQLFWAIWLIVVKASFSGVFFLFSYTPVRPAVIPHSILFHLPQALITTAWFSSLRSVAESPHGSKHMQFGLFALSSLFVLSPSFHLCSCRYGNLNGLHGQVISVLQFQDLLSYWWIPKLIPFLGMVSRATINIHMWPPHPYAALSSIRYLPSSL